MTIATTKVFSFHSQGSFYGPVNDKTIAIGRHWK